MATLGGLTAVVAGTAQAVCAQQWDMPGVTALGFAAVSAYASAGSRFASNGTAKEVLGEGIAGALTGGLISLASSLVPNPWGAGLCAAGMALACASYVDRERAPELRQYRQEMEEFVARKAALQVPETDFVEGEDYLEFGEVMLEKNLEASS